MFKVENFDVESCRKNFYLILSVDSVRKRRQVFDIERPNKIKGFMRFSTFNTAYYYYYENISFLSD